MNILPTGPHTDVDPEYDRYFRDLERWNFDIAYNAYYAFPMADVTGRYAEPYRKFTARAKAAGVPSCVQIQSVVAHLDDVPLTESQHYADNRCYQYEHFKGQGMKFHFGSFASRFWLEYLKRLTTIYREFGFDWVVFEEPMLRTDIPGTRDRFYELFCAKHPDMRYPTHQDESPEYLALQSLKRDTLTGFYSELAAHSKAAGFEKAGVMPWFFVPTFENTPCETWNTCCDTGRITFLDDLDFIVVRMQPDNIYAQVVAAAGGEATPTLAYYECLAHNLGKPIIMVNNPSDEHQPEANRESPLIPYPFFQRYTLAAAAAAPQGMSRHWYTSNYGLDTPHMELMAEVNDLLRRLGTAACEIAFVYSHSGASHVYPRPWREVWRAYWAFVREMTEAAHLPVLTFFAETLAKSLACHPEVTVIVLNEFFPIPPTEIEFLEKWLEENSRRRVVCFGGGAGHRWSPDSLFQNFRLRPPEMTSLVSADPARPVEIVYPAPRSRLQFAGTAEHDAILGRECEIGSASFCRLRLRCDATTEVLYRAPEDDVPVIMRRRIPGGGEAWFVATSLDDNRFNFPFRRFFDAIAAEPGNGNTPGGRAPLRVARATQNVFFNSTQNGYFVVSNCSADAGSLTLASPVRCWDVQARRIAKSLRTIRLAPGSIRVFRVLDDSCPVLDVKRSIHLRSITGTMPHATIGGMFHRSIDVIATAKPDACAISGVPASMSVKTLRKGVWVASIEGIPSGDTMIEILFESQAQA